MSVSSGQGWFPQQGGAATPPQYSPPGTPGNLSMFPPTVTSSPWGGLGAANNNNNTANLTPQQQQLLQQQQMAAMQQRLSTSGNQLPGAPGMPSGMPPGMPGGMLPPQQECCGQCCGPAGGGCCGPTGGGCCGPTSGGCCGSTGGCCGPTGGGCCGPTGGCCQMPGEPLDPYLCSPPVPGQRSCWECFYNCFDYTFFLMILFAVLSVVGFAVVLGTKNMDDIFTKFDSKTTIELDAAIRPYIKWRNVSNSTHHDNSSDSSSNSFSNESSSSFSDSASESKHSSSTSSSDSSSTSSESAIRAFTVDEVIRATNGSNHTTTTPIPESGETIPKHNCTLRKLAGSFGGICMEDNLYASVFATQLSYWNNARDTLWFLAMVYSILALLYAALIHVQRNPAGVPPNPFEALTPEKQQEFMAMTPAQQQAFMQQINQEQAMKQQMEGAEGCCGRKGVEVYDTPFYEFFRFAWLFVGLTVFVWTCNLFVSFWAFSSFYVNATTGPLSDFWVKYAHKFTGSVVMVTIFLAWPFCNFFLELVVWIVGLVPWVIIRSCCKEGVEKYRPALPNSQLPCCIRADMFFMDFNDVKRLGFSRQAWLILTGDDKFFVEACADPTIDRDPNMTQLKLARLQWEQMMAAYGNMFPGMAGMPPGMPGIAGLPPGMPGMPPGMPGLPGMPPGMPGMSTPSNLNTPTKGQATPSEQQAPEEGEGKRRKKRHHGSSHVDPGLEQTSGEVALDQSKRHRHRSESRGEGGSRRRHRSSKSEEGGSRRRHRSRSRSEGKSGAAGASPPPNLGMPPLPPPVAGSGSLFGVPSLMPPPVPVEGESKHRHRSSRSRERSQGEGGEGESRHRHRSSRSREKGAEGGEGGSRHRHRSSRSRERSGAEGGGESKHRHRSSRSRERSQGEGAEGEKKHRHRSSRSREKSGAGKEKRSSSRKAKEDKDLDALMNL